MYKKTLSTLIGIPSDQKYNVENERNNSSVQLEKQIKRPFNLDQFDQFFDLIRSGESKYQSGIFISRLISSHERFTSCRELSLTQKARKLSFKFSMKFKIKSIIVSDSPKKKNTEPFCVMLRTSIVYLFLLRTTRSRPTICSPGGRSASSAPRLSGSPSHLS